MQYGIIISTGDPRTIVDLAAVAEATGWDGVFYWDGIHIDGMGPMYDPWVVMAAIAMRTNRVRFGALVTPLSRRRPWKVARETVTLDHLSGGRLILPVGLGALDDGGFAKVGEPRDRRTRAELLDESLEILIGLWSGRPFRFQGTHYRLGEMTLLPPPVQQPRIPIWMVGAWPRERSMRRAVRFDGLLPNVLDPDGRQREFGPDDVRAMRAYVDERRTGPGPFDIVIEGATPGRDPDAAASVVQPWADAGATWWIESDWSATEATSIQARIESGPPRLEQRAAQR